MRLLAIVLSPAFLELLAIFLSIVWMLRDEEDKIRPLLVLAVTLNLVFGTLLTFFMGAEGGLLPWKYDHILFNLDHALGISTVSIAGPLLGWRIPLVLLYQWMVPMMICWFLVTRNRIKNGSVVLAYVAELIAGPILYALVPACGPIYAFGSEWLHPSSVDSSLVRLIGMPNAFPSLHIATALVIVLFAPGKLWRSVAVVFLVGTFFATLVTGEHYVIDLVPGLAFGCVAANVGYRRIQRAMLYLALTLSWSLLVRFEYSWLIAHPVLLRSFAFVTVIAVLAAVLERWSVTQSRAPELAPVTSG